MRPNQNNILEHLPFPLATSKCCQHLHFIQKLFSVKCRAIERRAGSKTEQAQHQAARSWSLYPLPFSPSKSLNDCLHDRARSKREPCLGFVSWSHYTKVGDVGLNILGGKEPDCAPILCPNAPTISVLPSGWSFRRHFREMDPM